MDRSREGGTLVTCINSPTPARQEKSKAQFRGPGERGRNSSYLYKFPDTRAREEQGTALLLHGEFIQVTRVPPFRGPALLFSREGGTLVTCINSPTPVQEKSRAQFRGPGERGRNSSYLYKFPDTRAREEQGTVPWTGREREEL